MANWTRPAVHVYQQFIENNVSAIEPFFELCVVGPSYLVVRDRKITNADNLITQDYSAGIPFTSKYPDIVLGAAVDHNFTEAYLTDAYVKMWPVYSAANDDLSLTVTAINDQLVTKIAITQPTSGTAIPTFKQAGVDVGDVVYVKVGQRVTQAVITGFVDPQTVYLSKNIATPQGMSNTGFDCDVTIIRAIRGNVDLPVNPDPIGATARINGLEATNTELKINPVLTATIGGLVYRLYSGTVYLTYRALRVDLASDFIQVRSNSESDGIVGACDPANPLGIAAKVVYSNAKLSFKFLPISSDNKEGYIKALDTLSTDKDVYVIVPLTQDPEVISAYAKHVKMMRDPAKSKWRKVYANFQLPTDKLIIEGNDGVLQYKVGDSVGHLVDSADGKFGTKEAAVGDYIDVYDAVSKKYEFSVRILNILNDSVAAISPLVYMKDNEGYTELTGANAQLGAMDKAVWYSVNRKLSTYGIAKEMVATAQSYSEKGLTIVGPSDEIIMTINGKDCYLPGYYLCVAYGALRAGFPPHQGFTYMGISGIKELRRSNKYFIDDDLDLMAGGGLFVVVQDTKAGLPYCIYQSTTDITELKTKEDSCVATIDFASMYYRDNLKAVLGRFNVNTISVNFVKNVCETVTQNMQNMTYEYIGPIITSGELISCTTDNDKIVPLMRIGVPFPVNGVDLYLQV